MKTEKDELATDLISAIKEFEETTAKLTSIHQLKETQSKVEKLTLNSRIEDENGPIDYFNRTKESLRHVHYVEHDINNNEQPTVADVANGHDEHESEEDYVKIPVQQLINTFEKQMPLIIKQKVNTNVHLSMDGSVNNSKLSATYAKNGNQFNFTEQENATKPIEQTMATETKSYSDFTSLQQQSGRVLRQTSHSIDEQYQRSTQIESTTNISLHESHQEYTESAQMSTEDRFSANGTQPDSQFEGGKA